VGLHLKGAAGSFRGFDDKPALTLNFDKFVKNQNYRGMDKMHCNNSVQDPSFCAELICGELARMMNIPAARTTHAVVDLNGKKKGLFTVKEGFNKNFLKRYFTNVNGNLYDGGFLTDIDADLYRNSGSEGLDNREDLKGVVKACREPDAKKRFEEVAKVVDIDRFISVMVFDALTVHWDGYTSQKNNYRIYHDPETKKIVFFVHGMDQMFSKPDLNIWPATNGMVSRAIWDTEEGKKRYEARLREVVAKYFKIDWMHRRIDEVISRVKPFAEKEVDKNTANDFENNAKDFKRRIKERVEFVQKELAKKK
jgi:spore coat protein CotH